jgi:hypothetical protein
MNTEEHDDLWELLGKTKATNASPFFSRDVLRAIRESKPEAAGLFVWLRARWKFAALGAGLAGVIAVATIEREERPDPLLVLASQVSSSPDYQVINHLDELLDSEQNSVWLEASAY